MKSGAIKNRLYLQIVLITALLVIFVGLHYLDMRLENSDSNLYNGMKLEKEFQEILFLEQSSYNNVSDRAQLDARYTIIKQRCRVCHSSPRENIFSDRQTIYNELLLSDIRSESLYFSIQNSLLNLINNSLYIHKNHSISLEDSHYPGKYDQDYDNGDQFQKISFGSFPEVEIIRSVANLQSSLVDISQSFSNLQRGYPIANVKEQFSGSIKKFYSIMNRFENNPVDTLDAMLVKEFLSKGRDLEECFLELVSIEDNKNILGKVLGENSKNFLEIINNAGKKISVDNESTRQKILIIKAIGLVFILLLIILIIIGGKKIITEISRTVKESERIQEDLSYRITVDDKVFDEFQIVLTGLNSMADKISEQVKEIRDSRDRLETRVIERTEALSKANEKLIREVNEKKKTEIALRESEEKYRTAFDNLEEAYFEVDLKGRFTSVNETLLNMTGYSRDELIGISYKYYVAPDNIEKVSGLFVHIYKTGEPIKKESLVVINKDGSTSFHELSASLLKDRTSEIIGFRGIARDITELKYAEEEREKLKMQLAYSQKMQSIGTLAGGIAHNFNNLLMGIQGNASIVLMEIDPEHPNYKNLKNIEKLVSKGAKLTSQLLGYAREGSYEVRPLSLNHIVKEISGTFGETRKEIKINSELSDQLWGIKVDQGQLEQVILNLLINASDAMYGGGELFIKTMNVSHEDMGDKEYKVKPGRYVRLTVKDTGIGMDTETMKRIFEPFFTTKGLANGTGLGLASAYGVIKGHGGYIDVESEPGRGTTFTIYLPAAGVVVIPEKETHVDILKGKGTILLVDDEEMVIDTGKQMLQKLGYEVFPAKSGVKALEIYIENKERIDLVLLDMVMPELGGGETYDRMKDFNPDVKVLLSSGYTVDGQASEILNRGCNGFIQKPFRLNELSHKIREIINGKNVLRGGKPSFMT